jgi:broad specificity phosphatase PhoE
MESEILPPVDAAFFAGIPAPTRFYFVRHGQSEANARRVVQGLTDYRLDDTGRAQAAALGAWLRDKSVGIDAMFCSPLLRAAETASILAKNLGLPLPEIVPGLRELDTGCFSNHSLEESRELFPDAYRDFERLSWEGVPDAERSEYLYARAYGIWELLRERAMAGDRRLLCVSHGGFIQWLVRVTFGARTWMPLLPTGNCGVFELLVEPVDGSAKGAALGGAKLYWERVNFQVPSQSTPVPPVF